MHYILEKLLKKQGIENLEELDKDEKKTFEGWQAALTKEELTVEDIKVFCQTQISMIETKWSDLTIDQGKKAEFIPYHTVYKLLLAAIDSPRSAREAVEKNLYQLIQ